MASAAAELGQLPLIVVKRLASDRLALESFAHFVRCAWRVHHPHEPLQWDWYLQALCDHIQAHYEGRLAHPVLVINLPPGLAKSYICSVCYPAWVLARDPWRRMQCSTAMDKNLWRDSRKTLELIRSDWYRDAFRRGRWDIKRDAGALGYWQTTEHGERISVTTKMVLVGAKPHISVCDDPLDSRDAVSGAAELLRLPGWWDTTWSSRPVHPTSPSLLVMQRLHESDPSAHVLRQEGAEHLCLPAEYDGEVRETALGAYDQRTEIGELLAPLRYDRAALDMWRTRLGPAGYSAQFQQRPTPSEGVMFDADWLVYWSDSQPPPQAWDMMFTSWDTGWKEGRRNDFTCGQLWGIKGHEAWLLAQVRGIWNPDRMSREALALAARAPGATMHAIENKAAGPKLISALAGQLPGVIPMEPHMRSKQQRASAIVPILAARRVHVPHPHEIRETWAWQPDGYEWVRRDFLPEYLAFPLGSKDDQIDALAQALGGAFAAEFPRVGVARY